MHKHSGRGHWTLLAASGWRESIARRLWPVICRSGSQLSGKNELEAWHPILETIATVWPFKGLSRPTAIAKRMDELLACSKLYLEYQLRYGAAGAWWTLETLFDQTNGPWVDVAAQSTFFFWVQRTCYSLKRHSAKNGILLRSDKHQGCWEGWLS